MAGKVNFVKRVWNYMFASAEDKFNRSANVNVQLQQALEEDRSNHFKLVQQTANVMAAASTANKKVDGIKKDLADAYVQAEIAVKKADDAKEAGDEARAAQFTNAAQAIAKRIAQMEESMPGLIEFAEQSSQNAAQAQETVHSSASLLSERENEVIRLSALNETAELAQTMASITESMTGGAGENRQLEQAKARIETKYETAKARAQLASNTPKGTQISLSAATAEVKADQILSDIRARTALGQGAAPAELTEAVEDTPAKGK